MKDIYDNSAVKFKVIIGESRLEPGPCAIFDFDEIFGSVAIDLCDEMDYPNFTLIAEKHFKVWKVDFVYQTSKFDFLNPHYGITFEDVVQNYFERHYPLFGPTRKAYLLCFLERYCMNHSAVNKFILKRTQN